MHPTPTSDNWKWKKNLIEDFHFAVWPRLEVALVKVVHADETVLAS